MSRPYQRPHIYPRVNDDLRRRWWPRRARWRRQEKATVLQDEEIAEAKVQEMRAQRDQLGCGATQKMAVAETELKECLALIQAGELGSLKDAVKLAIQTKAGLLWTVSASRRHFTPPSLRRYLRYRAEGPLK